MTIIHHDLQRKPTHPGAILREDFMPDYALTVPSLAKALGVSTRSVRELLQERRSVSPEMALRLGRLFDDSTEFWLDAQRTLDLWEASQVINAELAQIRPLSAA